MVNGGNRKHWTIDKENTAYPIVKIEPVLLNFTINTEKGRDMSTIKITNTLVKK